MSLREHLQWLSLVKLVVGQILKCTLSYCCYETMLWTRKHSGYGFLKINKVMVESPVRLQPKEKIHNNTQNISCVLAVKADTEASPSAVLKNYCIIWTFIWGKVTWLLSCSLNLGPQSIDFICFLIKIVYMYAASCKSVWTQISKQWIQLNSSHSFWITLNQKMILFSI